MSIYSHQPNLFSSPLVWSVTLNNLGIMNWIVHDYDTANNRRALTVSVLNSSNTKRQGIPLKISNRDRIFRALESEEALALLPIFRSQLEGTIYNLWTRISPAEQRPWKQVLKALRSWIEIFEFELSAHSLLSRAIQRTNDYFLNKVVSNERAVMLISGDKWHKLASEKRYLTTLSFFDFASSDNFFWALCEKCKTRTPAVAALKYESIYVSSFCKSCHIRAQCSWAFGDTMPSSIIPRVLLDDIMDIQLSEGVIYSYSSSIKHIQKALEFINFHGLECDRDFRIIGGREYERKAWYDAIKSFDPITSADLDFGRSSFIVFAALHAIFPT